MTAELPDGFGLALDPLLVRTAGGTVLAGGRPGRVLTLTSAGAAALDRLVSGHGADAATRALAGRLVAAGMAHPRRPTTDPGSTAGVTVVVPVRDRADQLERCLAALGPGADVVVVDDASADPASVAAVCRTHAARLVHREANGGPGEARSTAASHVVGDLVAFVDSDCTVTPGWLDGLCWHFADPTVGAVAPRVRPAGPATGGRVIHRFSRAHSPLDLGPDEGEVGPERAVRYVPTAALVVRRRALDALGWFAPGMRVGEDVDLVWRLVEAGWRVRYEPAVGVTHGEPARWRDLLGRRFTYGTSAGPLARRHPGRLAPVELRPRPALAAAAVLAGRPGLAAAAVVASAVPLARTVGPLGIPATRAWRWSAAGAGWTVVGVGRAATMLAWPLLPVLAARGRRRRWAAAVLVLVPATVEWVRRRPDLDPVTWTVACLADDAAYGTGVWAGCLRERTLGPLLPTVRGGHSS